MFKNIAQQIKVKLDKNAIFILKVFSAPPPKLKVFPFMAWCLVRRIAGAIPSEIPL